MWGERNRYVAGKRATFSQSLRKAKSSLDALNLFYVLKIAITKGKLEGLKRQTFSESPSARMNHKESASSGIVRVASFIYCSRTPLTYLSLFRYFNRKRVKLSLFFDSFWKEEFHNTSDYWSAFRVKMNELFITLEKGELKGFKAKVRSTISLIRRGQSYSLDWKGSFPFRMTSFFWIEWSSQLKERWEGEGS